MERQSEQSETGKLDFRTPEEAWSEYCARVFAATGHFTPNSEKEARQIPEIKQIYGIYNHLKKQRVVGGRALFAVGVN